jgi:hypothetical protein
MRTYSATRTLECLKQDYKAWDSIRNEIIKSESICDGTKCGTVTHGTKTIWDRKFIRYYPQS